MGVESPDERQLQMDELIAQLVNQRHVNDLLVSYVRAKVDQLLEVMGTSRINPHELDDQTLIELDPIGIVCGSFAHVLDNIRDTNSELRLARDEIKTIFDTAGAAILVLNPQREIVTYNNKANDYFLQGQKRVVGRNCGDVICSGNNVHGGCSFERVVAKGLADKHFEWTFNGRCFDVVGRPINDTSGEVTHVILSYTDISERKRSMHALREAREAKNRINGILRSVEDALIVSDDDGQVVLMNLAAEDLLSRSTDLTAPGNDFTAMLYRHLQEGRAQQGLWVTDLAFSGGAGEGRIFQARSSQIPRQGSERGGIVTFLHEVTKDREIERLKSDFVSTAAHELRTPLSSILGFSELILNEEHLPAEDLREYIGIVHQKAEGLAQIVNDLLDISRIESGEGLQLAYQSCSIRELCDEALLGFKVHGDHYRFELSMPDGEVRVWGDRFALAQVLENILSNAVKYSAQGSTIAIEVMLEGEETRICIADQGIGMTHAQLEKIFDKFYRADASNTAIPGTGLGMTIVKHIIEAHSGRVWVESHFKQGTRVCFTLPLAT